jgi:hypothetical protein
MASNTRYDAFHANATHWECVRELLPIPMLFRIGLAKNRLFASMDILTQARVFSLHCKKTSAVQLKNQRLTEATACGGQLRRLPKPATLRDC